MDDLNQMHTIIRQYLNFIEISYCPHDDNDKCNCRKPKSGMLEDLINKNVYPANKEDLKVEEDKDTSALGSIGLKPKIVR